MNIIWKTLVFVLLFSGLTLCQEVTLQQHVHQLIKDLKNTDSEQKIVALSSLGHLKENAVPAIPTMIQLLNDSDPKVQKATLLAFQRLGDLASPATYEIIKLLLGDKAIIEDTMKTLVLIGEGAVELLVKNLDHKSPQMRGRVLFILAEMGKKAETATPKIIEKLEDDVWQVRYYAVKALGKIPVSHDIIVPKLIEKMNDSHAMVQQAVVETCALIKPPALNFVTPLKELFLQDKTTQSLRNHILHTFGEMQANTPGIANIILKSLSVEGLRLQAIITTYKTKIKTPKIIKAILPFLKHKNFSIKLATIQILGNLEEDALPYVKSLALCLTDSNKDIKIAAANAIGNIGNKAEIAIPALLSALEDSQRDVQMSAAIALGHMGESAIPILIDTLKTKKELRAHASYTLGIIGKPAITFLLPLMESDDQEVRFYALEALGNMAEKAEKAIPSLISLLDKNKDNAHILDVLGRIGLPAVKSLIKICATGDKSMRKLAADALVTMGNSIAPLLLQALVKYDEETRVYIIYALGKIEDATFIDISVLVEIYHQTKDTNVKANIVTIIGNTKTKNKDAINLLLEALKNTNLLIKQEALFALEKLANTETIEPIVNFLLTENWEWKQLAAKALVFIGKDSVPVLIEKLPQADKISQAFIVIALGNMRADSANAVPVLIEMLKKDDTEVQLKENIIHALANIKAHSQITMMAIQEQLSSENISLKIAAISAMGKLEDWGSVYIPQLLFEATKYQGKTIAATVDAIANMGENSVPYIVPFLNNKEQLHKEIIARALGKMGEKAHKAVPYLVVALDEANTNTRQEIIRTIKNIGPQAAFAIPTLVVFLRHENWEIRELSAQAIGIMGKQAEIAIPALLPLLGDESWPVRNAITDALAKIGGKATIFGLRKALEKPYEEMRIHSLIALKELKEDAEEATEDIMNILKTDTSIRVRTNAIYALGEIAPYNLEVTKLLIQYINDEDWRIRQAVSYVLQK